MSDCKLEEATAKGSSLKGTTCFTSGDCIGRSAIYRSQANDKKSASNVIVFFHGWHVANIRTHVFGPDTAGGENQLREGVDTAGKDIILIVPFLGQRESRADDQLSLGSIKKKGFKTYLDQVIGLLSPGKDSSSIETLVLACHSGSDFILREATGLLSGDLKKKLKECWGFDCINSGGDTFGSWADGLPGVSFYFYVAAGSIDYGNFPSHLVRAYGTPGSPKKTPMPKVFLAPAVKNPPLQRVPDDQISESYADILKKQTAKQALTDYEKLRLATDPKLDGKSGAWETEVKKFNLKAHYEVVRDIFPVRIQRLLPSNP